MAPPRLLPVSAANIQWSRLLWRYSLAAGGISGSLLGAGRFDSVDGDLRLAAVQQNTVEGGGRAGSRGVGVSDGLLAGGVRDPGEGGSPPQPPAGEPAAALMLI